MLVLDEQIHGQFVRSGIESWYRGSVVSIVSLRPGTVIKDDAIPTLLLRAPQPTFVTINVSDFWHVIEAHPGYCVMALDLPGSRAREIPDMLRRVMRLGPFATRTRRMGNVIRVAHTHIERYDVTGTLPVLAWTG